MKIDAAKTPMSDHIARVASRLLSGEWRLILEHPNPAEGTTVFSPDVSQEVGRRLSTVTPAEVGGLWVPANPEHAKLGWSYDFEQTERIARAAYDSTGYDATMEVVEFVMAEADRRHRDALTTERAAHAETKRERDEARSGNRYAQLERLAIQRAEDVVIQRDEALKALEPFAAVASEWDGQPPALSIALEWNDGGNPAPSLLVTDFRAARRALAKLDRNEPRSPAEIGETRATCDALVVAGYA